jgi:hypothetical protein
MFHFRSLCASDRMHGILPHRLKGLWSIRKHDKRAGRKCTARLVKRGEAERDFDRAFWRAAGHEIRFAAVWQVVAELDLIRGGRWQATQITEICCSASTTKRKKELIRNKRAMNQSHDRLDIQRLMEAHDG